MRKGLAVLITGLLARAASGDEDIVTAPVRVSDTREGGGAEARALDEPAFVTVVHVDRQRQETQSAAEALAESVGVSVRSLGGLGAFASISMRGAPAGQTEILIDGVPLSRFAFSAVDVGSLDLGTFDRVEIFRGGVPVEYGGAVLGGAVNFVTRVGPRPDARTTELTLGGGSFGAFRARAARGDAFADGRLRTTFAAAYARADGGFLVFDDNGTPLNPNDDSTRPRVNNGYDQVDAVARAETSGAIAASGGARVSWKGQGVPGPVGVSAEHTRLTTLRVLVDARARFARAFDAPELSLRPRGYFVLEAQRWRDPDGEAGLAPADESTRTLAGGLALDAAWTPSTHHRVTAAVEGRGEGFAMVDNRQMGAEVASGTRWGGAVSLADEIVLGDEETWVLVPAVRGDLLVTRGEATQTPVTGPLAPAPRDDAFVSPRMGVRFRALPWLTVKGNVGRYFRPPTVVELFGDRGFVAGNPSLHPETGTTADLGVVVAPVASDALDRAYLETAAFVSFSNDLVAFLPTSGRFARAVNIADARLAGIEVAGAARLLRRITLTGNYTFLRTVQSSDQVAIDGKSLPGRPRHELYLRADVLQPVAGVSVGAFADVTYVSGNFLDEGNLNEVPARLFLGAGVKVVPADGITVTLVVKNLLDNTVETVPGPSGPIPRAVADVLDYPLPGRSLYASVDLAF
ncbi:MAG TPA: TonB-dependent receptor [Haliangiales bacterium]|nr:TonB-dependent receptor [Haliangiales bacterium]